MYCEVWLNILMQYNDEDIKTINIYPVLDIQQRTYYRIIDYGIKSFNENLQNYKIEKQRSKITIQKVVEIKQEKPKHKKVVKVEQIIKPEIIENNIYTEIIQYLNDCAGKHFKPNTKIYKDKIDSRLTEGYVLEDFKKVIEIKCKKWLNTKWADYLTPTTLFGDKFVNYVNENPTKTKIQKSYEAIAKSTELGWNNKTNN